MIYIHKSIVSSYESAVSFYHRNDRNERHSTGENLVIVRGFQASDLFHYYITGNLDMVVIKADKMDGSLLCNYY